MQTPAPEVEQTAATPVVATAPAEGLPVAGLPARIVITPELARMCEPFVQPDKGIHTEVEALAGAVRILSDRLGRNAHLRGLIRRMLHKRGNLSVKPLVDAGKAGRHRPLLKINQPLRQIQGHRLIAIRQAQKERVLDAALTLDAPKVNRSVMSPLASWNGARRPRRMMLGLPERKKNRWSWITLPPTSKP